MTTEQSLKLVFTYARTHRRHYSTGASAIVAVAQVAVIASDEGAALEKAKTISATLEKGDYYQFEIRTIKEIL